MDGVVDKLQVTWIRMVLKVEIQSIMVLIAQLEEFNTFPTERFHYGTLQHIASGMRGSKIQSLKNVMSLMKGSLNKYRAANISLILLFFLLVLIKRMRVTRIVLNENFFNL